MSVCFSLFLASAATPIWLRIALFDAGVFLFLLLGFPCYAISRFCSLQQLPMSSHGALSAGVSSIAGTHDVSRSPFKGPHDLVYCVIAS